MADDLELLTRIGLPADLLPLLAQYPRKDWENNPSINDLAGFWLSRHLNFRRIFDMLAQEAQAVAERKTDPRRWQSRLSRLGGHLLQELSGHHHVEDHVYFPKMTLLEPRLTRGFDILDRDHHQIDAYLNGFTQNANAVLRAEDPYAATAHFHAQLQPFADHLTRHLEDEEDLIIPVILKHDMA